MPEEKFGLIFDVDGVIADTEAINAEASSKVFADMFGVHNVKREDFEAGLGRGAEAYVKAAAEIHGIEMTSEQLEAAVRMRQENFLNLLRSQRLPAFPGILELISSAMGREDFQVAIATSGSREKSEAVLQSARIPYTEMVYVTGDEVPHKKPDPALFLKAAQRMNLPPGRCAVIEDAPNGVKAAHNAGCKCVAVTNTSSTEKLSSADMVVTSLKEVTLDRVRQLIEGRNL